MYNIRNGLSVIMIVFVLVACVAGTSTSAQSVIAYSYTFSVSRSTLPALFYKDMTYVVHLGTIQNPLATINGSPIAASTYNPTTGNLVFSSSQTGQVVISFTSDQSPASITAGKASLKDNRAWAWSHGMDDNVNLQNQIDLITAKGWRATLFMIGKDVSPTRQEPGWIIDQPGLVTLINQGWNIGDHTWSHACYSDQTAAEVTDGLAVVQQAVNASTHPDHVVISFAAPCFDATYDGIFRSLRNGPTTLLVDELGSGSPSLMNIDGADYIAGGTTATGFTSADFTIGRDTTIEADTTATQVFDWMSANAGTGQHFWFNTLTHGSHESTLGPVLDYAYTHYGPGGTNEIWMAPEDEIYSYLLVRDSTTISAGVLTITGSGTVVPTGTAIVSATATATIAATATMAATNTATIAATATMATTPTATMATTPTATMATTPTATMATTPTATMATTPTATVAATMAATVTPSVVVPEQTITVHLPVVSRPSLVENTATPTATPSPRATAPPATVDELLSNGGFEQANGAVPAGWSADSAFTRESDSVHEGSYSGRFRSVSSTTITINSDSISIIAGRDYTITGSVYSSDSIHISPTAIWKDVAGSILRSDVLADYTWTPTWSSFSRTRTAPAGAATLNIQLSAINLNGTIWVDGFSVMATAQ